TAPVAVDDNYDVDAGFSGAIANLLFVPGGFDDDRILRNDSDADGDTLTVYSANGQILAGNEIIVTGSNGGVFTVRRDGTVLLDASSGFEHLADGETGVTTISYTVTDGRGGFDTAVVSVTVTGQNDAVTANNDNVSVGDDSVVTTFDVLSNDETHVAGDTPVVSAVDGQATGVGVAMTGTQGGTFVINADGTASFDPGMDFAYLEAGQSASTSITYTITGFGGETSTATVSVDVNGANSNPIANDDFATVNEDFNGLVARLTFPSGNFVDERLMANDSDPEGDAITITHVNGQPLVNGEITVNGSNGGIFTVQSNGTASLDTNGAFDYLADGDTTTTSLNYTISDGNGGTATATFEVTITGVNDNPDAADDSAMVAETGSVTIDLLVNDTDAEGQGLSISNIDTTGLNGTVTDNGDGTITYQTNGQFDSLNDGDTANDWFFYTVSDGNGGTDTAQVQITVTGDSSNTPVDNDFGG
ncbi:MAG: Ig-like domain-containing protein, partial [Oleiphilaceae bacterium]|nr:Ig-like domain-containing protein [Oleiphilaceae bacterium]